MLSALVWACLICNPVKHPVPWTAVNVGLAAADYETAYSAQQHGCVETNPLFTAKHPSRVNFYTRGLLVDGAIESLGWVLDRRIPRRLWVHKVWRFPFAAVSFSHIDGIRSNLTCQN